MVKHTAASGTATGKPNLCMQQHPPFEAAIPFSSENIHTMMIKLHLRTGIIIDMHSA